MSILTPGPNRDGPRSKVLAWRFWTPRTIPAAGLGIAVVQHVTIGVGGDDARGPKAVVKSEHAPERRVERHAEPAVVLGREWQFERLGTGVVGIVVSVRERAGPGPSGASPGSPGRRGGAGVRVLMAGRQRLADLVHPPRQPRSVSKSQSIALDRERIGLGADEL